MRLHIGHHFFGSGNLGDDLMLAGFLRAATQRFGDKIKLSCAIPFDRWSQAIRFPQVKWLPYDIVVREEYISAADAWVGIGGAPFQADGGTWFVDHLLDEVKLCQKHNKPMFYLGVGVNTPRDTTHQQTRDIVSAAKKIWTREPASARLLKEIGANVVAGNDLSHIYLSDLVFGPVEVGVTGFVLNFEDSSQVSMDVVAEVVKQVSRPRWMVQEVRDLPGSEREMLGVLKSRGIDVRTAIPDYEQSDLTKLLAPWGTPSTLITSRYHATIIAAWAGWNVVSIERGTKVTSIAKALGTKSLKKFTDTEKVFAAIRQAKPASRDILRKLAASARRSCDEFFAAASV